MIPIKSFYLQVIILISLRECVTSKWDDLRKKNTVLVAVLIRNKEHTLPYFLTCLERLDYPKGRISLWFRSDNNVDNSTEVLSRWLEEKGKEYHSFKAVLDEEQSLPLGELTEWTLERYSHVIALREEALKQAKTIWADYLWMLDSDVFITNPQTLLLLVEKGVTLVAPLLHSDGLYSNFWGGMTPEMYYKRTDDYLDILNRKEVSCFTVPMIHSAVLIDMRDTRVEDLTYNPFKIDGYSGPHDDIIAFAVSANKSEIPMYICNDVIYGYVMIPLEKGDDMEYDLEQLRNLKLEILSEEGPPLEVSPLLADFVRRPAEIPLPVDRVFVISLARRPERRRRMRRCLAELRIKAAFVDAVDGQTWRI